MFNPINEENSPEIQNRSTPQLRKRRCSKSLNAVEFEVKIDLNTSNNQENLELQEKPNLDKKYMIKKFHRSYSQIMKEIEQLKPQKQFKDLKKQNQSSIDIKGNQTQKSRMDGIYSRLVQKYKLNKVSKEEQFQKKIHPFKELKTFVDLKERIQEMNIIEDKDFQRNLQILKIRDKVTQINDEMSKMNGQQDQETQQLTFKENMLNCIRQNYEVSQIKKNREQVNKNMMSSLDQHAQKQVQEESQTEWTRSPAPFINYLQTYMEKQKKSQDMRKREELIKKNIQESQKVKEFRQKLIEAHYDINDNSEQKYPQNQYYEQYKKKTDQIILDSKKQTTREYRKSFNLGQTNIGILNQSKQAAGGALSPISKSQKNTQSNENFFLTENTNTNSQTILNKIGNPLSKIYSQSNSSSASLASDMHTTPYELQYQLPQKQNSIIKTKFIVLKKNKRSLTVDDQKQPNVQVLIEDKNNITQSKDASINTNSKVLRNLEKITKSVNKIVTNYKEEIQKTMDDDQKKEKIQLNINNSSQILDKSQQRQNSIQNNSLNILSNCQNTYRSKSNLHNYKPKSDQIVALQKGYMKMFVQKVQEASDSYRIEKSDINMEMNNFEKEFEENLNNIYEIKKFNWEGLTKDDLADNVVNHYLFRKLRQRRIRSQQEFLRSSKINRTNF